MLDITLMIKKTGTKLDAYLRIVADWMKLEHLVMLMMMMMMRG